MDETTRPRRKASRDTRRQQLIEATIAVLAARGYAATKLSEVAQRAEVSHGMVNFHFTSKQNLLNETLGYLAAEYRRNWTQALERAGSDPAHQLDAILRADFDPSICTTDRLAAWCSFWGEAQCEPLYQEKCGANDAAYNAALSDICARLIEKGGYRWNPDVVGRALRCLVEGLWLEMMTAATPNAVEDGIRSTLAVVAGLFPDHFDEAGLRQKADAAG